MDAADKTRLIIENGKISHNDKNQLMFLAAEDNTKSE